MSELTIYQQIKDPVNAVSAIGNSISKSRIFGCSNQEQGEVLALECLARGIPPLQLAEQYHLIDGKLSMKSDAMLAGFKAQGGTYTIKEYSSEACEVVFKMDGSELPIRISWSDAQQEKWPFNGKGELKSTWSTPIGRQDMMFARVVSRGVRKLAPEVVCGKYTPEEIGDFDSRPGPANVAVEPAASKTSDSSNVQNSEDAEDAEFETVAPGRPGEDDSSKPVDGPCSQLQVDLIKDAIEEASQHKGLEDLGARVKKKLTDSGLQKLIELNSHEADQLLQAIESKTVDQFFTNDLAGHQKPKN